jgi:flagellar basal-body rod protein FlgB
MDLNSYLGIHTQALAVEARRTEVLAANLANVDTPNYKARDIDFKTALATASAQSADPNTAGAAGAAGSNGASTADAQLKYRVPLAPSLDGNTVDEQLEQAAFAENGVRYQATLTLLNSKLRALMTAITGQ